MTHLIAMCTFAAVMSISPGPVNFISLFSGAVNGIRPTLPFVSGATIGFTGLLVFIGLGAGQLLEAVPVAKSVLKYFGVAFLLYMSFKIFMAPGAIERQNVTVPKFMEGAVLQWLNPKAWAACLSGVALFTTADDLSSLTVFATTFFVVCYICLAIWAVMGSRVQMLLNNETRLIWFNRSMGTCLAFMSIFLLFN